MSDENDAIKELRENYKRRAKELAEAILALCDAQGCKSFASRDEIRFSDATVHLMVFVDPSRARAWLKTAASAPRNALVRDDDAAEAPATTTPRAESVKRPFAESDNNRRGNGADDGDDDGFHADIVPKKQEAEK